MNTVSCGFIGLGLIGGSIARALKEKRKQVTIYAYDTNCDTLLQAQKDGIADVICETPGDAFAGCDILFLCAPVSDNTENLRRLARVLPKDCILTDVGSVKTGIHEQIAALGLEHMFIGGHPMAGSERYGYANSRAQLLENAYYILTPTKSVPPEKVDFYQKLVSDIGAIPLILSSDTHDYVTAAISHLPHVIAASLVNLVQDCDSEDGIMKMIAAGGFKDITRIASSSCAMWQQICLTNGENIDALLTAYIESLQSIQKEIRESASSRIYDFFDRARIYRDSFINASSGPIKKSYAVSIEIADEPGALASIATILALNNISIKNIGILHNREQTDGVLGIEFYSPESIEEARRILTPKGYVVHEKK